MAKTVHPIAVLRVALNVTQDDFGKLIGVSKSYVKAIETGKRELTQNVSDLIYTRFGVDVTSYLDEIKDSEVSIILTAIEFHEQVQRWQELGDLLNRDAAEVFDKTVSYEIEYLVRSAVERGRGVAVLQSLDRWIAEAMEGFNLASTFKRLSGGREYSPYIRHGEKNGKRVISPGLSKKGQAELRKFREGQDRELKEWIAGSEPKERPPLPPHLEERFKKADILIDISDSDFDEDGNLIVKEESPKTSKPRKVSPKRGSAQKGS